MTSFLNKRVSWATFITSIAVSVVVGAWGGWSGYMRGTYPEKWDLMEPGTHGDMYGSLNALFTGLALVGVGLTIWMQSEQMRRQRAEYEAAETARREELKIAREQLEMAKIDHGNALEREKRLLKREQRQAEPVFVFTWDKFANQGYTLSNAGGAVTHVAATPGKVLPDDYCSMD